MDFTKLYNKYNKFIIGCNLSKFVKVIDIFYGASGNFVIQAIPLKEKEEKDENAYIILKAFFRYNLFNAKEQFDKNEVEIKFYIFLTNRYLLTKRTPHIIGYYNHIVCHNFLPFVESLKNQPTCQTSEQRLENVNPQNEFQSMVCEMIDMYNLHEEKSKEKIETNTYDKDFDLVCLEYAEYVMLTYLLDSISVLNANRRSIGKAYLKLYPEATPTFESVGYLCNDLRRIFFQVIFTQAIIKDDYQGYLHGDLFPRNIMLKVETKHKDNEFYAYHYKNKIFYLPANGFVSKINDFEYSELDKELGSKFKYPVYNTHILKHHNAKSLKQDIYGFLSNTYMICLFKISEVLPYKSDILNYFIDFFDQFIDTITVEKAYQNNPGIMQIYAMNGIKLLEDTVRTPQEYLLDKTFEAYTKLPDKGVILDEFNSQAL